MDIEVRTTGAEDVTAPWKVAVAGHPGSGKTLLASTAPKPLFVFFSEQPRIKSIARRYIPHVKVVNNDEYPAHEQLLEVVRRIRLGEVELETLVIDTGDELFQQMKEARRLQNGGEFGVGDWNWLGDAYREVIQGLVDLPVRLVVLYHLKSATENDSTFRELALQGSSKDDAPGWFDVIGALDTYTVVNDKGEEVTKRVLLTQSSRFYPWVKDHSGNLPVRFEISPDFVGDWKKMEDLLNADVSNVQASVLVQTFGVTDEEYDVDPDAPEPPVPTPDDLVERKRENATPEPAEATPDEGEEAEVVPVAEPDLEEAQANVEAELGATAEVVTEPEKQDPAPVTEADVVMVDEFGDEEEEEAKPDVQSKDTCSVCGVHVDATMLEIAYMRFRRPLCREHFNFMKKETNS